MPSFFSHQWHLNVAKVIKAYGESFKSWRWLIIPLVAALLIFFGRIDVASVTALLSTNPTELLKKLKGK